KGIAAILPEWAAGIGARRALKTFGDKHFWLASTMAAADRPGPCQPLRLRTCQQALCAWCTQGRLGPEGLHDPLMRFDIRAADKVDAIWHGREYAWNQLGAVGIFQALERFFDGLGLARKIDDQGGMIGSLANNRHLAR